MSSQHNHDRCEGDVSGGDVNGGGDGGIERLFPDLPFPDFDLSQSTGTDILVGQQQQPSQQQPHQQLELEQQQQIRSVGGTIVSNESLSSFADGGGPSSSPTQAARSTSSPDILVMPSSSEAATTNVANPLPILPPPAPLSAVESAAAIASNAGTTTFSSSSTTPAMPLDAFSSSSFAPIPAIGTTNSSTSRSSSTLILDGNNTLRIANIEASSSTTTSGCGTTIDGNANGMSSSSTTTASAAGGAVIGPTANTVPEFLYQLTKMLTDNNRDIIEWSNGKIEVHSPHKLETHVLNRYFRHSKFASFQRQLNYFGFRKLAGKGKMAPCSYVNDDTTDELASLLHIKRKPGGEGNPKRGGKKREREDGKAAKVKGGKGSTQSNASASSTMTLNPALPGIHHPSSSAVKANVAIGSTSAPSVDLGHVREAQQSQRAIARVAVGKGIRHGLMKHQIKSSTNPASSSSSSLNASAARVAPSPVQASLNALTNNFRNSLQDIEQLPGQASSHQPSVSTYSSQPVSSSVAASAAPEPNTETGAEGSAQQSRRTYVPGSLRRDDSLVDLAMIPLVEELGEGNGSTAASSSGFDFVDFPFDASFFDSST